jgi:hypothetical protein
MFIKILRSLSNTVKSKKNGISAVSFKVYGGDKGDRTPDLLHAMQALSQLSYAPMKK